MTKTSARLAAAGLVLGLAGPAAAQEYCGGIGSAAWIGGNESNSDISAADTYREQLALVLLGNAHVSLFALSQPAEVLLEAEGRGAGDPVIDVLDPSGGALGGDDDSGGGTAAATVLSLQPGTYCLRTTSYDNAPLTATVRIGRTGLDALTEGGARMAGTAAGGSDAGSGTDAIAGATDTDAGADDAGAGDTATGGRDTLTTQDAATQDTATQDTATQDTATQDTGTQDTAPPPADGPCGGAPMLASGPVEGQLSSGLSAENPVDQVATYAFELGSPATVSLTAENEAADPVLTLTGDDGTFYAENDDHDGLNSRIDMTQPLQPGTYCVGLRALSDAAAPVTVTLSAYDPGAARRALYDSGEAAPPLDGSHPVTDLGQVGRRTVTDAQMQGDTAQWFSVEMDDTGLMLIEAIATTSGDPVLRLYDDVGREIGYSDDYGPGLDSQIAARLFPGTYLIALTDISDSDPRLRLVIERYVALP